MSLVPAISLSLSLLRLCSDVGSEGGGEIGTGVLLQALLRSHDPARCGAERPVVYLSLHRDGDRCQVLGEALRGDLLDLGLGQGVAPPASAVVGVSYLVVALTGRAW